MPLRAALGPPSSCGRYCGLLSLTVKLEGAKAFSSGNRGGASLRVLPETPQNFSHQAPTRRRSERFRPADAPPTVGTQHWAPIGRLWVPLGRSLDGPWVLLGFFGRSWAAIVRSWAALLPS